MCGNSPLGSKQYEEGKICGRRRVKDGRKDFDTGRSFFLLLKKKKKGSLVINTTPYSAVAF